MPHPNTPPRVAFFPDSFHEVNGVAHTSRNFAAFAQRRDLPFLVVRAAAPNSPRTAISETQTGAFQTLELPRSRLSISLERDLAFDPIFFRHARRIGRTLRRFQPDLIHITGPSELGILGAFFAWRLGLPLAASWHTNVHEYAARRLAPVARRLGPARSAALQTRTEAAALWASARFYRLARVLFAPNPELCTLLERATHRPCHLMQRGVDTTLFSPHRRTHPPGTTDGQPVLGYVGRLSVEKNVALLPVIDRALAARGLQPTWHIVGHGAEEPALRRALPPTAVFHGVLRGEALATAYSNMDLLVFPSHTDTFGNVVLEALASGVPAAVTPSGGPRFIVQDGVTGTVTPDDEFAPAIASLLTTPNRLATMSAAARTYALRCSWDAVFDQVYAGYGTLGTETATVGS